MGAVVQHHIDMLVLEVAAEDVDSFGVVDPDRMHESQLQCGKVFAQRDQPLVPVEFFLIESYLRIVAGREILPDHGLAVAWVIGAPHAGFVAVVDHGGPDKSHLPGDFLQHALALLGIGFCGVVVRAVVLDARRAVEGEIGVDEH